MRSASAPASRDGVPPGSLAHARRQRFQRSSDGEPSRRVRIAMVALSCGGSRKAGTSQVRNGTSSSHWSEPSPEPRSPSPRTSSHGQRQKQGPLPCAGVNAANASRLQSSTSNAVRRCGSRGKGLGSREKAGMVASRSIRDKAGPNVGRLYALLRRAWPAPRSFVAGFTLSARSPPLPSRERRSDLPL